MAITVPAPARNDIDIAGILNLLMTAEDRKKQRELERRQLDIAEKTLGIQARSAAVEEGKLGLARKESPFETALKTATAGQATSMAGYYTSLSDAQKEALSQQQTVEHKIALREADVAVTMQSKEATAAARANADMIAKMSPEAYLSWKTTDFARQTAESKLSIMASQTAAAAQEARTLRTQIEAAGMELKRRDALLSELKASSDFTVQNPEVANEQTAVKIAMEDLYRTDPNDPNYPKKAAAADRAATAFTAKQTIVSREKEQRAFAEKSSLAATGYERLTQEDVDEYGPATLTQLRELAARGIRPEVRRVYYKGPGKNKLRYLTLQEASALGEPFITEWNNSKDIIPALNVGFSLSGPSTAPTMPSPGIK